MARVLPTLRNKAKCGGWLPFPPGGGGEGVGGEGGIQKQQKSIFPRANQRTKPTICQLNAAMTKVTQTAFALKPIAQFANAGIPVCARPRIRAWMSCVPS